MLQALQEGHEPDKLIKVSDIENLIYFKKNGKELPKVLEQFSIEVIPAEKNELAKFLQKLAPSKKLKLKKSNYRVRSGVEIIKAALESLDLKSEITKWRSLLVHTELKNYCFKFVTLKQYNTILKRIRIFESFLTSKTDPSWMLLSTLPVLPPSLRPLVELENGRLVAADVNEIYRLIIIRNIRLSDFFFELMIPDIIGLHARKLLQESVDNLIDNARVPKEKKYMLHDKALKSLTEVLEGKQGRFRQSLLGKRVDYSGRSVIVVGPMLRLNQCGLPYDMAKELFQPFLINQLLNTKIKAPSHNTKLANIMIKKNKPFIWTLLTTLTQKYSILLNRAPTLHRFGIQAFDSLLVLGQAIHLHPLVCTGFNADFDGDQMAVHLPLYEVSQLEIRTMMRPSYNVLSPSNGEVILKPTQDMVIGCYYLTLMITKNQQMVQKWFANEKQALAAFYQKKINIHTPILVRYKIFNLAFEIENKKLNVQNSKENILFKEMDISVMKIFYTNTVPQKAYLITNIGVLIAQSSLINFEKWYLTNLFLETTPGRLIFSINFKNSIA